MNRHHDHKMQAVATLMVGLALVSSPSEAQTVDAQKRAKDLDRKIVESEKKLRLLQQRIEMLEKRLEPLAGMEMNANTVAAKEPTPKYDSSTSRLNTTQTNTTQTAAPSRTTVAAATPPSTSNTSTSGKPGTFEVDEAAAQRALERTLTQTGALLLPAGSYSITPGLNYTRTEFNEFEIGRIINPETGTPNTIGIDNAVKRNEFTARVDVKYGLPYESQLELGLPYQHVNSSRNNAFGENRDENGNGIGDFTIGLAKTLYRQKGWFPDLIGRLTYNTGSGKKSDNQVNLEGGYKQLSGEFVALMRQDPLAFYASANYSHVFEDDNSKPGNVTALSLGTVLAASPETSIQFGFSQIHRQRHELDGRKISGSEQTYGVASIGASSILSRSVMLQTTVGIGLGNDAPAYSFNIQLPIVFH